MTAATWYRVMVVANLVLLGVVLRFDLDLVTMWVALALAFSAYAVGRKSGERHGAQEAAPRGP